ncbi:MAG: hypothetical protein U1E26_04570 [Coriobacteriia bacterium]|nr:hypothetical protein [Coriobacteriia bacterium]
MDLTTLAERFALGLAVVRDRLPRILEDPRAYPRETMILALIVSVTVIVVVLLILWLAGWLADSATRSRLRIVRRGSLPTGARWLLGVGAFLAVAGVMTLAPAWSVTSPVCGACHAARVGVDSWRMDVHNGVGCYGCHAQGGLTGPWEASARGVAALVTGTRRPPAQDRSCVSCHPEVLEQTMEAKGIRVRHTDIIGAGLTCLMCHQHVGHAVSQPTSVTPVVDSDAIERPTMARCMNCHDGDTARAECSVCHVGRKPSDSAGVDVPRGDTPAPVTCIGCHKKATDKACVECHGLVLPHPPSFRVGHAGKSLRDPALCAKCHESAVADTANACACHDVPNVHGTYSAWFPVHSTAARTNGPGGCRCHESSFCGRCHEEDPFR